MNPTEILVDTETGVNYLYHGSGYGEGLTVLLDRNGKPVVTMQTGKIEYIENP